MNCVRVALITKLCEVNERRAKEQEEEEEEVVAGRKPENKNPTQ